MSDHTMNDGATIVQAPMKRSVQKRSLILDTAMRHFAENGYEAAHMGEMANQLGIAKGSVFQHFGSKDGLFFEAYKSALRSLPPYLDVPPEVREAGFFAVVRHRLSLAPQFLERYRIPYRVVLLGNYGSDLALKKRIVSFVANEDPLGMAAFVQMGVDRGEVRTDVDPIAHQENVGVQLRTHARLSADRGNRSGTLSSRCCLERQPRPDDRPVRNRAARRNWSSPAGLTRYGAPVIMASREHPGRPNGLAAARNPAILR